VISDLTILDRVIAPKRGNLSPDVAREILAFSFSPKDRGRYEKLSAKAQLGTLSKKERAELENYLNVNDLLTLLKAKAASSLRRQSTVE
jgi:hypothetical protein